MKTTIKDKDKDTEEKRKRHRRRQRRIIIAVIIIIIIILLILLRGCQGSDKGGIKLDPVQIEVEDPQVVGSRNQEEYVEFYGYNYESIYVTEQQKYIELINPSSNADFAYLMFTVYDTEDNKLYSTDGYVEAGKAVLWNAYDTIPEDITEIKLVQQAYGLDGSAYTANLQVCTIIKQ